MERRVIETGDGSFTLELQGIEETYHSRHGAIQESEHVFIQNGLNKVFELKKNIKILEVGFGTGLNALLTRAASKEESQIAYTALETVPLQADELRLLGYEKGIDKLEDFYNSMHTASWGEFSKIDSQFSLRKLHCSLQDFQSEEQFDLIYFDAFGPRTQPELWSLVLFQKLFEMTASAGVFVTYCAKGQVRRDLKESGYEMERLEGPPGKRHMLRGVKK